MPRIRANIALVVVLPFVAETRPTPDGSRAASASIAAGSTFQSSFPGRVVPPPPTADEQAKFDRELQEMREARASKDEAAKYDRLLKVRYRNEQAHDRARDAALERLRSAMASSEKRVIDLADERKRLLEEAEFFKGRKMPDPLRQRIETNADGTAAQRQWMKQQQDQINDIDRQYDAERQRLRKLWDGAQPGTVGPVPRSDAVKTAG